MNDSTSMKVALVTGASSGFGLLFTLALAREGFIVIAAMRSLERQTRLTEAVAAAETIAVNLSSRIDCHLLDVTDATQIEETAAYVTSRYGRLDLLVNNAGFAMGGLLEDVSIAELRKQFETNFFGHAAVTKALLPIMRRQRSGKIIVISSIGGRCPIPGIGAYAASKFALEAWTEVLHMELSSVGIKVVLMEPGSFDTDIWTRNSEIARGAMNPASPNKERSQRFAEAVKSGTAKRRSPPAPVVGTFMKIVRAKNPRLRYLVGNDARITIALRTLLPARVLHKLLLRTTRIDG